VAKNEQWKERYEKDWDYVSSMSRFFKWWIKRQFGEDVSVDADILPVIPGKLFDRMSLAYLLRDHNQRGSSTFHFYLAYFKPMWSDCKLDTYHSDNFGLATWRRPKTFSSLDDVNARYFADNNCAKISHLISHEFLRRQKKKRKIYFDAVHNLWSSHVNDSIPFLYYDRQFHKVTKNSEYRYITIDLAKL
jgi:hypothetical protein